MRYAGDFRTSHYSTGADCGQHAHNAVYDDHNDSKLDSTFIALTPGAIFVSMDIRIGSQEPFTLNRVLVDNGATLTVIDDEWTAAVPKATLGHPDRQISGLFCTKPVTSRPMAAKVSFSRSRDMTGMESTLYPVPNLGYDMILGTDLLARFSNAVLDFKTMQLQIDGVSVSHATAPSVRPALGSADNVSIPDKVMRTTDATDQWTDHLMSLEERHPTVFDGVFTSQPAIEATGNQQVIHFDPQATPHRLRASLISQQQAAEMNAD